jgi:TetR/AcrR family transcriptional regulator, transcriptional repressor for nem operon
MRKSKSEAAETRRHIIATASREFRRNGVNGTGLADCRKDESRWRFGRSECNGLWISFLSEAHRDDPSQGCPLAALGAETARCDRSVRDAATEGFTKLIDILAGQLTNIRPDRARKRALVVMSTMIGALTMSRVVDDPGLSDTILRQAERHIRDFLAGK